MNKKMNKGVSESVVRNICSIGAKAQINAECLHQQFKY
jgi:hypothetical protein